MHLYGRSSCGSFKRGIDEDFISDFRRTEKKYQKIMAPDSCYQKKDDELKAKFERLLPRLVAIAETANTSHSQWAADIVSLYKSGKSWESIVQVGRIALETMIELIQNQDQSNGRSKFTENDLRKYQESYNSPYGSQRRLDIYDFEEHESISNQKDPQKSSKGHQQYIQPYTKDKEFKTLWTSKFKSVSMSPIPIFSKNKQDETHNNMIEPVIDLSSSRNPVEIMKEQKRQMFYDFDTFGQNYKITESEQSAITLEGKLDFGVKKTQLQLNLSNPVKEKELSANLDSSRPTKIEYKPRKLEDSVSEASLGVSKVIRHRIMNEPNEIDHKLLSKSKVENSSQKSVQIGFPVKSLQFEIQAPICRSPIIFELKKLDTITQNQVKKDQMKDRFGYPEEQDFPAPHENKLQMCSLDKYRVSPNLEMKASFKERSTSKVSKSVSTDQYIGPLKKYRSNTDLRNLRKKTELTNLSMRKFVNELHQDLADRKYHTELSIAESYPYRKYHNASDMSVRKNYNSMKKTKPHGNGKEEITDQHVGLLFNKSNKRVSNDNVQHQSQTKMQINEERNSKTKRQSFVTHTAAGASGQKLEFPKTPIFPLVPLNKDPTPANVRISQGKLK